MRNLIAVLLIVTGGPALSLSCKAPNFGEDFNRIAVVEEVYSVAYGKLREVDPVPEYIEGQPRSVKMLFVGKMLGGSGFGQTGSVEVMVNTECVASWCGPIPTTQTQMIAFLEHQGDNLSLRSAACGPDFLLNPTLGQIGALRACMRQGSCGEDEIGAFDLR